MKITLWRALLGWLQRRSNTAWVNRVQSISYAIYRATYNPSYRPEENGEYRALNIAAAHVSGRPAVVLDVGANVGRWSLAAARAFGTEAYVFALEPSPPTYRALYESVAKVSAIRPIHLGLSDESGPSVIQYSPGTSEKASLEDAAIMLNTKLSDYTSIEIDLMRGDRFCNERKIARIDFLKIDTEGHDLKVLRGFGDFLRKDRVAVVQFEYNRLNVFTGTLLRDFYDLLLPRGYVIGRIFPGSVRFKDYAPLDENFIDGNFLAVSRGEIALVKALS